MSKMRQFICPELNFFPSEFHLSTLLLLHLYLKYIFFESRKNLWLIKVMNSIEFRITSTKDGIYRFHNCYNKSHIPRELSIGIQTMTLQLIMTSYFIKYRQITISRHHCETDRIGKSEYTFVKTLILKRVDFFQELKTL